MIINENRSICVGCHACINACQVKCLVMERDKEGFLYPEVNNNDCISCGMCETTCPTLNKIKLERMPDAYAAYSENEIRLESSSGGIFTIIAKEIINEGGVVFGAVFDKDFQVVHDFTDNIDDLSKFRGSKYVQSQIGGIYKKAEMFLKEGRLVLFTGTPCQVAGLKSYLRQDYEKLISQDIICQGVPSPLAWSKYLNFQKETNKEKIKKISFREKSNGWAQYSMRIDFNKGKSYIKPHENDLYMKAFSKCISLRPACYECKFKGENRASDITLADFWGINSLVPKLDDNKGMSLVLINTVKGQNLFDKIKANIIYKEVDFLKATNLNPMYLKSALRNKFRDKFFNELDIKKFENLVNKYCSDSKSTTIIKFIKLIIRKILVCLKLRTNCKSSEPF